MVPIVCRKKDDDERYVIRSAAVATTTTTIGDGRPATCEPLGGPHLCRYFLIVISCARNKPRRNPARCHRNPYCPSLCSEIEKKALTVCPSKKCTGTTTSILAVVLRRIKLKDSFLVLFPITGLTAFLLRRTFLFFQNRQRDKRVDTASFYFFVLFSQHSS